jgi:alkanesulfonate monooxygenase SsuD/methylene tetrahydromethanopterin reductase-like flavin-dependent oxidoreductase (luciferase family)
MSAEQTLDIGLYVNNRAAVFLEDYPLNKMVDTAVMAEELGYHSVWVGDSILAKPRYRPIPTLAAIAGKTHTVKLGTAILQPQLYNPVLLALDWATLDVLAGGRTILGVGIGAGPPQGMRREHEVCGVPKRRRGKIFEEVIEIVKKLWTEDVTSYTGTFYRLEEVSAGYKPRQKPHPPIWIAAGSYNPKAAGVGPLGVHFSAEAGRFRGPFARVARLGDGWFTVHCTPQEYAETWQFIQKLAREEYGRNPADIHPAIDFWINVNPDRDKGWAEAKWMLERYHNLPMDDETVRRWCLLGSPQECIQTLRAYAAAGVRMVMFVLAARDQQAQAKLIAEEILPAFRG